MEKDEEYKIIEDHDDPEIKSALGDLQKSLTDLQNEVAKRDQRKLINILTNYMQSNIYAIRARYSEGITVSKEQLEIFKDSAQLLEDFTNGLFEGEEDEQ